MLRQPFALVIVVAAIGCNVSADPPEPAHEADAAPRAIEPAELHSFVIDSIAQWDRRVHASCLCLVSSGTYDTVEACMHWLGSGPDWMDCAMRALDGQVSVTERESLQCELDFLRTRADCYEAVSCDAVLPCDEVAKTCAQSDHVLEVLILKACPDTGLLSRLDGGVS
jgi:hypothetical protein